MQQDWEAGAEGSEITAGRVVELVWLGASPAALFKQSRQKGRPSGPPDQTLRSSTSYTSSELDPPRPAPPRLSSVTFITAGRGRERQRENQGY